MEKHLIEHSLDGKFAISLLVTKQTALLVVYLMFWSQAYEILERLGQEGGWRALLIFLFSVSFLLPSMAFHCPRRGTIGSCWI